MGNEELQESVRKACGTKFSFLEMSQIQNASLIIAVDFVKMRIYLVKLMNYRNVTKYRF